MRVLASRTCDRAGDFANRLVEALRQIEHFAGRSVEVRRNRPAQAFFLRIPEFDCERSLVAAEKWRRNNCWARMAFFGLQPKPCDGQFIGMAYAQHLDPHQFWRDHDGVAAVAGDRIDQLQPRRRAPISIEEGAVAAHVGDRTAGLDAAQHIPPSQVLVLD